MNRVPVPADASLEWAAVGHRARFNNHMLTNVGEPAPGSHFATLSTLYPFASVAEFTKGYLGAALEHLQLWAEYAAPLKFHPDHEVVFSLRPAYTLARAAIEAAAPAIWLMNTNGPRESLRRYFCLVRWDMQMHAKSTQDPVRKAGIEEDEAKLLARIEAEFTPKDVAPPGGYESVVKLACEAPDLDLEPDQASWIWRAASGSAHGMPWAREDLQVWVDGDDDPNPVRVPDTERISEALRAASSMTAYGCYKFAAFCGEDIEALYEDARVWLVNAIPIKPDADPQVVAYLKAPRSVADPESQ